MLRTIGLIKNRTNFKYLWIAFILCAIPAVALSQTEWKVLAKGIAYTHRVPSSQWGGSIHAFLIDLNDYRLDTMVSYQGGIFATDAIKSSGAVLAINGGFFTPEYQSIGLRINQRNILSPFKNTSWLGVFMIKNHRPIIIPARAYHPSANIEMAIQAGPRLIVDGYIPKLSGAPADRSAIGITAEGKIVIVVTDHFTLTMTELAQIMKKPLSEDGFECVEALNLDGGSSSQLSVKIDRFHVDIPSLRPVADFILIVPQKKLKYSAAR
jgi:exopolysaccharide biosynthesis protein